jgi:Flp pilus assembly protein CpaB
MAEATVLTPPATPDDRGARRARQAGTRQVKRRQSLPTGRAVVGGFLVAIAALGIYLAWAGATRGPTERFVVASRDLPIGTELTADDLSLVAMDLPPSLAASAAFDNAHDLVGVRVINPISEGELVQASSLLAASSTARELEISFAIDSSRAVGGTLKAGDRVDFLATFGAGTDTYTATILHGARVLAIDSLSGALGSGDTHTVTLGVATADEARAVAHAVNVAKVTLVRSGGPDGTAGDDDGVYRAPAADAGD